MSFTIDKCLSISSPPTAKYMLQAEAIVCVSCFSVNEASCAPLHFVLLFVAQFWDSWWCASNHMDSSAVNASYACSGCSDSQMAPESM